MSFRWQFFKAKFESQNFNLSYSKYAEAERKRFVLIIFIVIDFLFFLVLYVSAIMEPSFSLWARSIPLKAQPPLYSRHIKDVGYSSHFLRGKFQSR